MLLAKARACSGLLLACVLLATVCMSQYPAAERSCPVDPVVAYVAEGPKASVSRSVLINN
jgi:hypothetical protein